MGQDVVIKDTVTMGDVLMVDTDRSFTGQDGHVITLESERLGVPGKLADGLFALDLGIDYVYVLQNSVTVRRDGGWDDDAAAKVAEVTGSFLRFYPDTEDVAAEPSSDEEE
ncbi:MAG TPA: hypothetical protein VK969_03205 [Acidimicrobiia bacterium]|nr:hypothetical protein [Acidimicrobiia bacterium]